MDGLTHREIGAEGVVSGQALIAIIRLGQVDDIQLNDWLICLFGAFNTVLRDGEDRLGSGGVTGRVHACSCFECKPVSDPFTSVSTSLC